MPDYRESITVDAPPQVVYDHWRRFEDYPAFMSDVAEVRDLGGGRLVWRGRVGDDDAVWETELTDDAPGERLAWRSVSGAPLAETVELAEMGGGRTRVTWTRRREREQGDLGELFMGAFGHEPAALKGNLELFKQRVEGRAAVAAATGDARERSVGATDDGGAAVARGEAPGVGPAVGAETATGEGPTLGAGMSAPGAVTSTPEPLPPGYTGNRGTASAPSDGAGISQRGGGTGGMGGGGSTGDDSGTGGTASGLGLGASGGTVAPDAGRREDAPPPVGGVAVSQGRGGDLGTTEEGMGDERTGMSGGTFGGSRESDVGPGLNDGMRGGHGADASGAMGQARDRDREDDEDETGRPRDREARR
ncbi:MAG TPA: SRPBCC family protein [Chloroflexaceae bacterium]|mgnify:CR=1 FL=1|nr:SRPBCC family protein [Chloroflexaceae bacterium]